MKPPLTQADFDKIKEIQEAFRLIRENHSLVPDALYRIHRTNQQSLMRQVIVPAIKHWAECYNAREEDKMLYDDRNEATVKVCAEIVSKVEDLDWFPFI